MMKQQLVSVLRFNDNSALRFQDILWLTLRLDLSTWKTAASHFKESHQRVSTHENVSV